MREVLVRKRCSVDRLAPRSIAARKVAALAHKAGHDAVKRGAFEVEHCPARRARATLASAERAEVLARARHRVREQLDLNPTHRLTPDVDL